MRFLGAAVLVLTMGCSTAKPTTTRTLTERQRDSILATEPLPGASVVGRALNVSDLEASRAAGMKAQMDSLPR